MENSKNNNSNKKTLLGAGPFYFEGNKIGIMILHGGGGGTCADLKPLAENLQGELGYTVHVPLLPGFGTSPEDLRNTPANAWIEAVDREFNVLKAKCEKVIVGGHSMGGILTLILAAKHELDGIFTISTPIDIKGFILKFIFTIARFFMRYLSVDIERLKKETNGKWVGYDKIPLNMVPKFKLLKEEMKNALPKIECPAILFQGRLDAVIKENSMDVIFDTIKSKKKKKVWLENNDHPILNSPDHDQIVMELANFVKGLS